MKEYCNLVYKDLIARYGELAVQVVMMQKEMSKIQSQLELLNVLSPQLQALQNKLNKDE